MSDFRSELRRRLQESEEQGRTADTLAEQKRQSETEKQRARRQRVLEVEALVTRIFQETVSEAPESFRYGGPRPARHGYVSHRLEWIGPGPRRAMVISVGHEHGGIGLAWHRDQGSSSTGVNAEPDDPRWLEELIYKLIDQAQWEGSRMP